MQRRRDWRPRCDNYLLKIEISTKQEVVNPISDAGLIRPGNATEGTLVNQDKLLTLFTLASLMEVGYANK